MKRILVAAACLSSAAAYGQGAGYRDIAELVNRKEPAWPAIHCWIATAKNKIEVLPKDSLSGDSALLEAQVTTRSPLGAVVYETGGIMIDGGWIRIIGSGHPWLRRSVMQWNKGKSFDHLGEEPAFLLIADDAVGGFFAINHGGLDTGGSGKVYYFAPDRLRWEPLGLDYSGFLWFCFTTDLDAFYKGLRWKHWREDLRKLSGNEVFMFVPWLFSMEGKDIEKDKRKGVSVQEAWDFYSGMPQQGR